MQYLRLQHVPIALRLGLAFGVLLALLAAMVGYALHQAESTGEATRRIAASSLDQVRLAGQAKAAAQAAASDLQSLFLLPAREQRVPVYASLDEQNRLQKQALDRLLSTEVGVEDRQYYDDVSAARASYALGFGRTVDEIELSGPGETARGRMATDAMPALRGMLAALDRLVAAKTARAEAALADIERVQAEGQQRLYQLGVLAVLMALGMAWAITRSIARPLAKTAQLAREVAKGNLASPLPEAGRDEVGELIRALDQMRTGIAEREAQISDLAFRDGLTGLANRTLFLDRLTVAVAVSGRSAQILSVIILDLDRFKSVNDALGHEVGDELLRQVAQRLETALPRSSDTLARLGGDEFAVLLPTEDAPQAALVARRLLSVLEAPVTVRGQNVDVSASLGIASYTGAGCTAADLMAQADTAMYAAKQAGSGYACFDSAMLNTAEHGLTLLSDLRRAVDENELYLQYQPKVRLLGGGSHSAEALLRWRHPERGFVPPDQFIGFAEKAGFINTITRWVLTSACHQLARWQAEGLHIDLNINISTRDLVHQDLPAFMRDLLMRTGIEPQRLCLEVTESAIMEDPDQALASLQALHHMGVGLSIDDFGTGYSSLAYLKRLPVQELKIDRSFVSSLDRDDGDATIVRSTIEMAHSLGLRVVAEGVESEAALGRLMSWGCDQAQGYLFSRPLATDDFTDWVSQRVPVVQCQTADLSVAH